MKWGHKLKMYYNKDIKEVSEMLATSEYGLTSEEAIERINKYGKNSLPKKKKDSIFKIFLCEFKDPMIILLLIAIIASFLANELVDA